ncbi:hypothetical protein GCM10028775_74260 [Catellatospora paridis]
MRACEHCKVDISHKRSDARFCNKPCKAKARHAAKGVPPRSQGGTCTIEGCGKPWKAQELCSRHYQRLLKYGDPLATAQPEPATTRRCVTCGASTRHRRSNAMACSKPCKLKAADRRRNARPSAVIRKHARRARMLGNPGLVVISAGEWERIKRRHDGRCAYCHRKTSRPQMDHVVPLARGGRHAPSNVLPACAPCNLLKSDFFLSEWRLLRGRR